MQSPDRASAVQGRRAQAAALADALACLDRTTAGMASLAAYGNGGRSRAPGRLGQAGPGSHPVTRETSGLALGSGEKGCRLQRALVWGNDAL